ncbi:hypothetical protein ACLK14_10400 [Escherichia coli]
MKSRPSLIKGTLPRLPDPQEDSKQAEKLANWQRKIVPKSHDCRFNA